MLNLSKSRIINQQVLNVDFEGRPAEDSDVDGIKTLLKQLFSKAEIDLYEMADCIVSQNYVGSVLHQVLSESDDEDEDDDMNGDTGSPVFGVLTIINITDKNELGFVKSIKDYIIKKCCENSSGEVAKKLEVLFSSSSEQIGLIINERILDTPQIALPNFESLWKDVEKAVKKKMKYDFSKFLILTRSCMPITQKKKKMEKQFINPEDEIFFKHSLLSFDYSVKVEQESSDELPDENHFQPTRTVMIIEADKVPTIMAEIKTLC